MDLIFGDMGHVIVVGVSLIGVNNRHEYSYIFAVLLLKIQVILVTCFLDVLAHFTKFTLFFYLSELLTLKD